MDRKLETLKIVWFVIARYPCWNYLMGKEASCLPGALAIKPSKGRSRWTCLLQGSVLPNNDSWKSNIPMQFYKHSFLWTASAKLSLTNPCGIANSSDRQVHSARKNKAESTSFTPRLRFIQSEWSSAELGAVGMWMLRVIRLAMAITIILTFIIL